MQDTTEVNVASHRGRIRAGDPDLGVTGSATGLGFFLHTSLALDASDGTPLGFPDIAVWNRPQNYTGRPEGAHKQVPLEQKESYKWVQASHNTQALLQDAAAHVIIVQDREGDIYEQFVRVPNANTDLLVRAAKDRKVGGGGTLFKRLEQQEAVLTYEVYVPGRGKRAARWASVELRYCAVQIERPHTAVNKEQLPPWVQMWAVEVREVGYTGPDALLWRLLTTVDLGDGFDARMMAEWYSWRWTIEEIFRIVKKEGFDVERSELETGAALRKLTLLIMETAVKLLLMRFCYAEPEGEGLEAGACFTQYQQVCIEALIPRWEGKTQKQKNPFPKKSLRRCVWLLARMGGWKGYEHKRHPGITCLWIGLKHLAAAMQGWAVNRNVSTR